MELILSVQSIRISKWVFPHDLPELLRHIFGIVIMHDIFL